MSSSSVFAVTPSPFELANLILDNDMVDLLNQALQTMHYHLPVYNIIVLSPRLVDDLNTTWINSNKNNMKFLTTCSVANAFR